MLKLQSIAPGKWKAIQIFEGAQCIDMPGIVSSLSAPLSKAGVEMLYLSTFHTDVILCAVLRCLARVLSRVRAV